METADNPVIVIRYMESEDVWQVADIEKKCFSEPWSEKAFNDTLSDDNYMYIAAASGKRVVGYAGCVMSPPEADITNIAVESEYRRMGIGEMLMEQLAKKLSERNIETVFLEVRQSNEAAKELYRKQGFEYIGVRKNFYRKPDENGILMAKKLQQ